jgi:hypothetical protein
VTLNKNLIRSFPILLNATKSVITPLLSLLFSYIIIKSSGHELWGQFVEYLLFFYIAGIVCNWGSKMYLLRLFSINPGLIIQNWQHYFMVRLPIVVGFILALILLYNPSLYIYLIVWLISVFIKNSVLPIVFYQRDFLKMIIVELLGFALLFFLILQANALTFQKTIEYYSLSMLFIAMGYIILYPKFFYLKKLKVDFNLLKLGLPFTLLAITGFLQSKVDLYVLNFFTDKATLGNYQIISGLFVFSQSIAGIIALPYIKNIFRMSAIAIIKIKNLLKWFGLIGSIITTIAIYFVLKIYEIELSLKGYVFGFFISFLCYLYTIDLYVLLKENKDFIIVKISTLCLIINLFFSILFLSFGMNLEGVLLANAICQFIAVLSYKYYSLNKLVS